LEIEHNVFLEQSRLPDRAQLVAVLRDHDLGLELQEDMDPAADEVVLKLRYRGEATELEYYANPVNVQELRQEGLLRKGEARWLGERDFLISVVAHDDLQLRAADALAAAVSLCADGQLADAGEPPFIGPDTVLDWVRKRAGE